MVRVNKKPQHLVFCLHSRYQPCKYRALLVESFKSPCATCLSGTRNCPETGAKETVSAGIGKAISGPLVPSEIPCSGTPTTRTPTPPGPVSLNRPPSSLEPVGSRHKAQEQCNSMCKGVEMWTTGVHTEWLSVLRRGFILSA